MSNGLSLQPTTPRSLKVVMVFEGVVIVLLSSWLYSEYNYALTFRNVVNDLVFARAYTWTAIFGMLAGLAGSAAALSLRRTSGILKREVEALNLALKEASSKREEKMTSTLPKSRIKEHGDLLAIAQPQSTSIVPVPLKNP